MSPSAPPNHYAVTWAQVAEESLQLAGRIEAAYPGRRWTGLLAVARGGLVPAALLATRLNIRRVETVCLDSYDGTSRRPGPPRLNNAPPLDGDGSGWLVIDDLVDSGASFALLRQHWPAAVYGCLFAKPAGMAQADLYADPLPQSVWVDFPWEEDELLSVQAAQD